MANINVAKLIDLWKLIYFVLNKNRKKMRCIIVDMNLAIDIHLAKQVNKNRINMS